MKLDSADFLLEIGTEEIPARFLENAHASLNALLSQALQEHNLKFEKMEKDLFTPRRLVFFIKGLSTRQPDTFLEIKGPSKRAAFTDLGRPTQAAIGFASSQGVDVRDLTVKDTPKGEYLFATKVQKGKSALELLGKIIPEILSKVIWPKSMRWEENLFRFARPIRWILALLGKEVVPFSIADVSSGNSTLLFSREPADKVRVSSIDEYFNLISKAGIILDYRKRMETVENMLQMKAKEIGGRVIMDEELIAEVANLVEAPSPVTGEFNPAFLEVPKVVIEVSMKKHQRVFPVETASSELMPKFILFGNGLFDPGTVRRGNEKVLAARLSDALFYLTEDLKRIKDRGGYAGLRDDLRRVVFQEKLGSVYDRTVRLEKLCSELSRMVYPGDFSFEQKLLEAARLSKNDLTLSMVLEFTELEGIMGGIYALKTGVEPEVAEAIKEQYLPRGRKSAIPVTRAGRLLAVADKLDLLTGSFILGQIPTGSADPLGLRRAALGIIEISIGGQLDFSLSRMFDISLESFCPTGLIPAFNVKDGKMPETVRGIKQKLQEFILNRLESYFREKGFSYDVVQACIATGGDRIVDDLARLRALSEFRENPEFLRLVIPARRVNNIIRDSQPLEVSEKFLVHESEKALYDAVRKLEEEIKEARQAGDHFRSIKALISIAPVIDAFFDGVMVMDRDENLRNNRIALLQKTKKLFLSVAELSLIVVSEDEKAKGVTGGKNS